MARESTIIGMAVMDALDDARSSSIMLHGVADDEREHVLERLVELGWQRDDDHSNGDARGARSGGRSITMWP